MLATHHYGRTGWRGSLLASALILAAGMTAFSQSTIVYNRMPLNIVPPQFPWDAEAYRAIADGNPNNAQSVALDINGDGQKDYHFICGMDFGVLFLDDNKVAGYFITPWERASATALPTSAAIGPSMLPAAWIGNQDSPLGLMLSSWRDIGDPSFMGIGEFAGVASAYLGLELQIEGRTHYGWIRLGAPLAHLGGGWIYDYAYETRPDTPILAGAIPEPSTLALLVGGGVLIVWFRGRRNERRG